MVKDKQNKSIKRLLLVDSEHAVRTSLKELLEYESFEVDVEDNGVSAFEKISTQEYDVVLSDIQLPKMDTMTLLQKVRELGIEFKLNTMVLDVSEDKVITATNTEDGLFQIKAKAVILAMGCRERSKGALNIAGSRPAGIYSAGTAQKYVNMKGYLPGKNIVILGSGDIGLIMARRMTLEGAKVHAVCELMPYSGGLARNIEQCLNDFGIPLKLSHTIIQIHGKDRVEGVTIAKVDERRKPITGTEEYIACDTILFSVGLLPENELSKTANVALSPITSGAVVDQDRQTSVEGIFSCGNVLHVHDLVDYVSEEAEIAGKAAVEYINGKQDEK